MNKLDEQTEDRSDGWSPNAQHLELDLQGYYEGTGILLPSDVW